MGETTPPAEILAHLLDERVVSVRPSLIRILGSAADAVVLQQLSYWMPKATAELGGEAWVYKTYPEWAEETGLPSSQVKCSMQRLEAAQVVESCQPEGYSRRKWYRLRPSADSARGAPSADSSLPREESAHPSADFDPCSSTTESTQENTTTASDAVGVEAVSPTLAEGWRLSHLLADLIEANGSKRPAVTSTWARAIDRMLRLDGRTSDQVENCIRWSQADEFWRGNVLSAPKLRQQYDRLRLAALRGRNAARSAGDEAIEDYERRYGT